MNEPQSVFQILGEPDAALLEVKAHLGVAIARRIKARGFTQQQAADAMRLPRSEVSRILAARLSRFTIDRLVMALLALDPTAKVLLHVGEEVALPGVSASKAVNRSLEKFGSALEELGK